MKTINQLLLVTLVAVTTNFFVWFALIFWAYLNTQSVITTSIISGTWVVAGVLAGIWFGPIVDRHRKKSAMLGSSIATLVLFAIGFIVFNILPQESFLSFSSMELWLFSLTVLLGSVAGSMYGIAMPTLIGLVVPEKERSKVNGLLGTIMGMSFGIVSVASGFVVAFGGMFWVLAISIIGTLASIVLLSLIEVPEKRIIHIKEEHRKMDIRGTIKTIGAIPGLFALILFTTFNNFMGGAFMSLMDAYGLNLVPVEIWGIILGLVSSGFILSGIYISRKGLPKNPLINLFRLNIVMWITCILFPMQPSIILLLAGMYAWTFISPFIEATEQTIFQKVVPKERLGRVFGFAHSVEQAASPVTAFMIGPITQLVFIPFMTTGAGVELIGSWFGVGPGRGIAIVFILAGIIGLIVTLIAMRSKAYKMLAEHYQKSKDIVSSDLSASKKKR